MTVLVQIIDQDSQEVLLQLDASISETHAGDVEATDHPVEQGANLTDHLRPKPRTLTIQGVVSNTPIRQSFQTGETFPRDTPGPAEAAYLTLEARRTAGLLHQVQTKLAFYQNMALISISEPRSAAVGDALQMQLTFKEIRVVQNLSVVVQTAAPQHQPRTSRGAQVAAPVQPSEDQRSAALQLKQAFLGR